MLLKLSISNFAIIKQMVFEPVSGLNIITGETGAGKSIILDALNLILGSRADIKTQSEWGEKCIIEGEFALDSDPYADLFKSMDIDFDAITIIRKEINVNGKTRTFINDSPVSLQQLKTVTDSIVNIHSQHENSHLNDRPFQFDLLDTFAGNTKLLNAFRAEYKQYRKNEYALQELKVQQDQMLKEKDYIAFLLGEFESASLQIDEERALEDELNILNNSEQVALITSEFINTITDSEQSIVDTLNQLKQRFKTIEKINPASEAIYNRIQSCIIELKDISADTASLNALVQADPQRLEYLNERLSLFQSLKRKHNVTAFNELMAVNESLADQLFNIGNIDSEIEGLLQANVKIKTGLLKTAEQLHQKRLTAGIELKSKLEQLLKTLEMPNANLEFDLSQTEELNEYGNSQLQIRFTANLGMPMQLLNKVASGGELSRLALCIRSIEATQKHLNVLVFDEIDTGVSGKVADTIGNLFRQISLKHQVIAITHLPQVAGYGDAHFMVGKKEAHGSTESYLKNLKQNERVEELAKMLSGNTSTEIAKQNAAELLKV